MSHLIVLYLILFLPLIGLPLNLLIGQSKRLQKVCSVFLSLFYLFSISWSFFSSSLGDLPIIQVGGWPSSIAISLGLNHLSIIFLWIIGLIYFSICLYSVQGKTAESSKFYFPLLHTLFFGLTGAFLTYDLFNLFVLFEITLISSFALLCLDSNKLRLSGTIKYIVLSFFSSVIFLVSIGLIYRHTGTLDMLEMSQRLQTLALTNQNLVNLLGIILFIAFAIKSALFPFYVWLPASYPHTSPGLSGVFSGLLTKLGLYSIFRVLNFVFPPNDDLVNIVLIMAGLTMLTGVLGAIIQKNIRKILVFHTVSQIGYMVMGLAFLSHGDREVQTFGLAAVVFYIIQYIPIKTNLFFISGLIRHQEGTEDLDRLSFLRKKSPTLSILFGLTAAGLIGLPPSSGFWAKFLLIQSTVKSEFYFIAVLMIIVSFFTLYSMIKIWSEAFWPDGVKTQNQGHQKSLKAPLCASFLLLFTSLTIALNPSFLMNKVELIKDDFIMNQVSPLEEERQ